MAPPSNEFSFPVESDEIVWNSDSDFHFRGVHFAVDLGWAGDRAESSIQTFTLVKNLYYLTVYLEQLNIKARNVFEVGFFEGGSSVFLDRFYQPEMLVALDRRVDRISAVDSYRHKFSRGDHLEMVYGADQADAELLMGLCDEKFDGPLDLVIDDASHQYELTKATFNVLFPRVRPGGIYVIEDWGWAHDRRYQAPDHVWAENPSLANLIFEIALSCAGERSVIDSVSVNRAMAIIVKGGHEASTKPWDVSGSYLTRGRTPTLL